MAQQLRITPQAKNRHNASFNRSNLFFAALLFACLLPGCSGNFPRLSDEDQQKVGMSETEFFRHYVVVERDGYPLGKDDKPTPTLDFKKQIEDAVKASLQAPPDNCPAGNKSCPIRLLLFVHGGLNSYRSDFQRMVALMKKDDGLLSKSKTAYHPIFVNWNSSLDTVADDLLWIRLGDRMSDLGPISFPFLLPARMALAMANVPVRLAHTVNSYKEYCDFASDVKTCGTSVDDYVSWGMFPFYTLTAPILESFGSPAWYQMKRRAKLATASRLTTISDHKWASDADKTRFNNAEGAALTLVTTLGEALKQQPRPVEVTLVGHSMGAFIVNRMLAAVTEMECAEAVSSDTKPCSKPKAILPIKNIAYLAPASPIDEFDNITLPFVGNHPDTHAWLFTLNRKDEAGEYSTWAQRIVPRGSLLTWIDGIFEPASSLGEKTLGRMANLEKYYAADHGGYQLACPSEGKQDTPAYGFRSVKLKIGRENSSAGTNRVHVYQSLGYCQDKHQGPEVHGDFSQPRYLGQVLCMMDKSAFKQADYCTTEPGETLPGIRRLPPWYD